MWYSVEFQDFRKYNAPPYKTGLQRFFQISSPPSIRPLSFRREYFVHTYALSSPHVWLFSLSYYIFFPSAFFINYHSLVTSSTLMITPYREISQRQRKQKKLTFAGLHPRRPHVLASFNLHGPSIRYHEYLP